MAPSQLKRLKRTLREKGVIGEQQSKKHKKQAGKNGTPKDSRIQKNAALLSIREHFNPFEVKQTARKKHDVTSDRIVGGKLGTSHVVRPSATKSVGENNRRRTLLVEMERRKKVGGITDRRFGEDDPTMSVEEKALQRFVREKQRGSKEAIFDLEDGEDYDGLTHSGQALNFDQVSTVGNLHKVGHDDQEESETSENAGRSHKRRRLSNLNEQEDEVLQRYQKTKNEVMKEVIAKSKLHKHERQQTKDNDDELRAELDKGLPDLFALMHGTLATSSRPNVADKSTTQAAPMNPDRLALLNGKDRLQADREYDQRLKQMAMDQRAIPTTRTLPEEERAELEVQRLKDLEERRLKRMDGNTDEHASEENDEADVGIDDDLFKDEDFYGLGKGLASRQNGPDMGIEDEDDFLIDENLVASDSDLGSMLSQKTSDEDLDDDGDATLLCDMHSIGDLKRDEVALSVSEEGGPEAQQPNGGLAYTYTCPQTHEDLLEILKDVAYEDVPTIIQRIRILHQPQLASQNKAALGAFTVVLVDHISYMANGPNHPPFSIIEALIRHIHSLAKTFPEEVGRAFRSHLREMSTKRPTSLNAGDLTMLTAIGSIFPTSDHFHHVVTPAVLCMSRYLEQKIPSSLSDLASGTFVSSLSLHYQRLSKRYIPEVINYVLNALNGLAPLRQSSVPVAFPYHTLSPNIQICKDEGLDGSVVRRLSFWDTLPFLESQTSSSQVLKYALLNSQMTLIDEMCRRWSDKSAFCELLGPASSMLRSLTEISPDFLPRQWQDRAQHSLDTVNELLKISLTARRPLCLQYHKPLAIKSSIPKFEESYNPDKHYDPDRDRAETSKLKAEYKRERKGALRELRKDANFIARESLKEKKEKDNAYERKYKRLVAEIQGEEGREAKSYEREKKARKGKTRS